MKLKEFLVFLGMVFLCCGVAVADISFIDPTPPNESSIYVNYTNINVSIPVDDLTNFTFNWNGTNTTYLNDSCVLHLSFDNNSAIGETSTRAVDVSQYGNNGSFVNGSTGTWTTDGEWNGAMNFDGVNDYVDCGNDSSFDITDEITIGVWFKANSLQDYILSKNSLSAGDNQYAIFLTGVGMEATYYPTSTLHSNSNSLKINEWQYIALTRDCSGIGQFYIDGQASGNPAAINMPSKPSNSLNIGRRKPSNLYFDGSIDEVRIYNRALSPAEIRQSYLSNLRKFNESRWYFETNQTNLINNSTYNYQAFANNIINNYLTDYRILYVGFSPIIIIPLFHASTETIKEFPKASTNILTSFLSFLPLFVGILISGALILVCVGVFGKLKRW